MDPVFEIILGWFQIQGPDYIAKMNTMVHSQNKFKGEHLGENIYWCSEMVIWGHAMTAICYDD